MAELQSDLMSCFSAEKPYTRQITEIPAEESIASEAFYTAKNELETKLSVIYGQRNNESLDNSNLY